MTCRRIGNAIICGRSRPAPAHRERLACRWPGCERRASQGHAFCRPHWFKLPPDLRDRLWRAVRAAYAEKYGRLVGVGDPRAYASVRAEVDKWIEDWLARPAEAGWRQPELPL